MSEWIRVEDGLPPRGDVLVYYKYPKSRHRRILSGYYHRTQEHWNVYAWNSLETNYVTFNDGDENRGVVTHWAPLLDPPEEK